MAAIYWLIAFVILVGVEVTTMALTTIWFAGGALVSFILALCGVGVEVQLSVFFIVSCVLLFCTRPFALKYVNKKTVKTNAESLIGKKARITIAVDNDLSVGAAVVNGQEWTARSVDGSKLEAGDMVKIEEIRGVKLIVSKLQEGV